jgi:dihydrofolate reductase
MTKVILFNLMTLDGYFAGPDGEIDWHNVDDEFNEFAIDQLNTVGGLIFGRVTYQMMASYWPTPEAIADDPVVAGKMNELPKIVFSRSLDAVEWSNTRLVKGDAVQEITQLRSQAGKDLYVFGSADLAAALTQAGLIDEYRVIVNPVILGKGRPLFPCADHRINLSLTNVRTFRNGNVLLYYVPANKS